MVKIDCDKLKEQVVATFDKLLENKCFTPIQHIFFALFQSKKTFFILNERYEVGRSSLKFDCFCSALKSIYFVVVRT